MKNFLAPRKILIIDDMKVNILAITKILSKYPFEVFSDCKADKIEELCETYQPDVILLDYEMPEVSGVDACKRLKANHNFKSIPIVFVTAQTGEKEIVTAFDAGAVDYVIKPVREKELLSRLNNIFITIDLHQQLQNQIDEQVLLTRVLSHDINNLIVLIQSGLRLIERSQQLPDEEAKTNLDKGLHRSKEATQRITDLVKNVRELILQDQYHSLKLEAVEVLPILHQTQEVFNERLHHKKIKLEIDCPSNLKILTHRTLFADSIINNIISNAIKFSKTNSKVVVKANSKETTATITIRDYGIGMSEEVLSKVFSKSESFSRPGTDNEKGTGFGMTIVKRYMERLNGKIDIQSQEQGEHQGTLITLSFYI